MPGELTPTSGRPDEAPLAWWPDGADEAIVRDCNCEDCTVRAQALDDLRDGQSPNGRDAALSRFENATNEVTGD